MAIDETLNVRHARALFELLRLERAEGRDYPAAFLKATLAERIGGYSTNTIDSLEARGLVRRIETAPRNPIELTPKGRKKALELEEYLVLCR